MPPENKQLKVLLVDDDHFLLDMYLMKFKKANMMIDALSSSLSALEKLRGETTYDIIILDILMPNMDGVELLKKIREEKVSPSAVIIILTNHEDDFESAKNFGVDGYIIKATTIPSEVVDQVLAIYNNKHKPNA